MASFKRKSYPKQFTELLGEKSLFQMTAERLYSKKNNKFNKLLTITNSDFRFIVDDQLRSLNIECGKIIIEPLSRNTAPAILAATFIAMEEEDNPTVLVSPSDHIIQNPTLFYSSINKGLKQIESGKMVCFGISPKHPETGYGYLQVLNDFSQDQLKVKKFIEKPSRDIAEKMLIQGNYLWNSGIFLFKAKDLIEAFKVHANNLLDPVKTAVEKRMKDLNFEKLDPTSWVDCENISIDYAIMEKMKSLNAVKIETGWSDLGEWNSVERNAKENRSDDHEQNTFMINCENSFLRSESRSQVVVGLGLENIIAVAMTDAVLIAKKDNSQDVGKVVEYLRNEKVDQADNFPKQHRPWGWFESLTMDHNFQVKRIFVKPGGALSLQSHKFRSEHWVVVSGTAKVTVQDETKYLKEGQSIYVPEGAKHRLENPYVNPMILIEVQTGSYLGEDDIIRYEDIYARD